MPNTDISRYLGQDENLDNMLQGGAQALPYWLGTVCTDHTGIELVCSMEGVLTLGMSIWILYQAYQHCNRMILLQGLVSRWKILVGHI